MIKDDVSIIAPTLKELKANFLTKKSRPIPFRLQQLHNLLRGLKELRNEFYEAFQKDLGYKDQYFCELVQYQAVLTHIECDIKNIYKYTAKRSVSTSIMAAPGTSYLIPEPYGVVLVIGAWNYPIFTCIPQLSQAIGAGNAVVVKPSELVPHVSNILAKLITNYLDQSLYRAIEGGVNVAINITKQHFDLIIFTGGTEKGKLVAKAAAENLVPCILELGGKGPCIIDSSSDLALAGRRVVSTKLLNCGQTCVAPDYLLVEESILDNVVNTFKQQIKDFYGPETKNSECLNRIVNEFHTNRIAELLNNHGGKVVHGGQFGLKEKWIEPTFVVNPDPNSELMKNEIFGPILPIITYKNIEDAINFINSRPKPLALYYFGTNKAHKNAILESTSSGGVCINDCIFHLINQELPFGGVGDSGYGVCGSKFGFDQCQHLKPVLEKSTIDPQARYPPYTDSKKSQMKFLSMLGTQTQSEVLYKLLLVLLLLGVIIYVTCFCGCSKNKQQADL
ncbi:unnamed protein product (macronuclear) [Paramecium tetraurelia]|uniref:Aldehyde dehydrogenase n=1 Tax=Paramecium tetraurelia TaxID=5888 RepID=A0D1J8_PARTE|nr:uncharacterized protein GSPATT00012439001 [Paramecium tetraurelia]CAK76915.1 unnamed protein product [Paramecium tetraurelia]|eukprot:XP_001444312.1 hypothetical protein (macronuclear) [Paramecium tetraurelia strain d4-2]